MSSGLQTVVVTAAGGLCPAGVGLEALRAWCANPGEAREIPAFQPADYINNPRQLRTMHRGFQLFAAAAALALRSAGLPASRELETVAPPERSGVAVAIGEVSPITADLLRVLAKTAVGPIHWGQFSEVALHELHPFRRLTLLANMAAAHLSLLFGLRGPGFTLTSGRRAGLQAIREACWAIAAGAADLMICAGADCPEQTFSALSTRELGVAIVLESRAAAERRGATIRLELIATPPDATGATLPRSAPPTFPALAPILAELPASGSLLAALLSLPQHAASAPAWNLEDWLCQPLAEPAPAVIGGHAR